jgi:hypothetical protein
MAPCNDNWSQLSSQPIPSDWTGVTGGVFRGAAGGSATIGGRIDVLSDLTIICDGDLTISGIIAFGPQPAITRIYVAHLGFLAPPQSPNITLVSVNGRLTIAANAAVGLGSAAGGADDIVTVRPPTAAGVDGVDAGFIRLVGVNVDIEGLAGGAFGGYGGRAAADALAGNPDPLASLINAFCKFFKSGGTAKATGGAGKRGSDIFICARDSVNIGASGTVCAGDGGQPGKATATADTGAPAEATAGKGGAGGDVVITGTAADCEVFILGSLRGGDGALVSRGSTDESAVATGGSGHIEGGAATARGADGGPGGTVYFNNCVVEPKVTGSVAAGNGGFGGEAIATGGTGGVFEVPGSSTYGHGFNGGPATATGGSGAKAGATPVIPLNVPPVTPTPGAAGRDGAGGDATATGGNGGSALPQFKQLGGDSGPATATGGSGGSPSVAPPSATVPSVSAGQSSAGATGLTATQPGRP